LGSGQTNKRGSGITCVAARGLRGYVAAMLTVAGVLADEGNAYMTGQGFGVPLWLLLMFSLAIGFIVYRRKRRP
jgi:hypothetical protein